MELPSLGYLLSVTLILIARSQSQTIQISPSSDGEEIPSDQPLLQKQPISARPGLPSGSPPAGPPFPINAPSQPVWPNPAPASPIPSPSVNTPPLQPSANPVSAPANPVPFNPTPGNPAPAPANTVPVPLPVPSNPAPANPVASPALPISFPVPINSPNSVPAPSNPFPLPINPAPSNPVGSPGSPGNAQPGAMSQINQLSSTTADLVSTLNHQQLVSLFQIMILQQAMGGGQGRPGILPSVLPGGAGEQGSQAGGQNPNVDVNVHVNGYGQGGGSNTNGTQSPLLQMTLFKGIQGPRLLKVAEEIKESDLGKYVVGLHDYWKNAPENVRDQYRNDVLKNIDSLNVLPKIKHAVQELLPGLALGQNPAGVV